MKKADGGAPAIAQDERKAMEQIKSLIFEVYSAGFEAGMNGKDIVSAYNEFFDNNIKPELIKYT